MELLIQETTQEEIMALYHQVYQLKRKPGKVPCSQDMTEETHVEILEMLWEHLLYRWGPTHPEPRQRSAQVEFHAQMQVTYNHFGHLWDR